jgi:hypothetical protein
MFEPLFGTDGVRRQANNVFNRNGHRNRVVIGKDTRYRAT